MNRTVRPGRAVGSLQIPGSRSLTNRALVTAALAIGRSVLRRPLDAEDTSAMRGCLRALGVTIEDGDPAAWSVHGSGGRLSTPTGRLEVGASGTTARFITALGVLVPGAVVIDGSERMRSRPITDLVDALIALGAEIEMLGDGAGPPLRVGDRQPVGRSITMDAAKSSQYVSAVALIAPRLAGDTTISFVDDLLVSRPYIEMTIDVMTRFGAIVELRPGPELFVHGSTGYSGTDFAIEPDFSAAVYPAAAAAITGGDIRIEGLSQKSQQADRMFFDVLEEMGCGVDWTSGGVQVHGPERLRPVRRDMGSAPDAALMLAVVCAFADGESIISNIGNLRIKESDRLIALEAQLASIGITARTTSDSISVEGGRPHGGEIEPYDDHRIAMSFAVAGLVAPGMTILDSGCVAKTWPGFFDALDGITVDATRVPDPMGVIIALDGPGGSGKTTVSRAVGERLSIPHLDTGAFYRAATLVTVEAGIDPDDSPAVIAEVNRHEYGYRGGLMLVDERDVSAEIRTDPVTRAASPVSAIPEVRRLMVAAQREWVREHGGSAVVEGRDIGTVVFPDADLKVYLTARREIRARRRATEHDRTDIERVAGDLERRDSIDSSRKDSPLTAAADALVLDTSDLTIEQVVDVIVTEAQQRKHR
ncbi:MAG: 3-phosphoshikimate 1-carboxyvinyltransferase [Acidimicrobiia bacterium]|nr:3-phosphoshikimate 1-carboxyvinyltransferase [Acidimicrobiia bacterium]